MGKIDIRATGKLSWDEFKDKSIEQALPAIYGQTVAAAQKFSGWYWASIKTKRITSLSVRFSTFLLLAVGTLFPILAGLWTGPADKLLLTQLGVCALALAGLLQIADRVFGWSSGWLRYITTATAMENLSQKFEFDWAAYILGKGGHVTDADVKPLFDIAVELQVALMKLQVDETDKWVTEFNTGAALLGDLIKSQRETSEKANQAASAALAAQTAVAEARQQAVWPGEIEVTLLHPDGVPAVDIALDGEARQAVSGATWFRQGVPPGPHTLVVWTKTAPVIEVRRTVEVAPGGLAKLEIDLSA